MSNINNNMQTQTSNTLHNAIMEAGSKDRPPMLAPGNYVQWKSRIKRYIDTKPNHELIHYCLENPPYELGWKDKEILTSEGSLLTRTERVNETYKNVSQDIRDQLNAEAEAKAIKRLKHGESINVQDLETNLYWEFGKFTSQDGETLESYYSWFYKMMNELIRNQCKSQELKTVSYHKLYGILKQHQHEVNEIRAEKIARNSSTKSQQAATRNRGKAIVNSQQPIYDQEPSMVDEDDETSKDKEIDKLMALISLSINKNVGYENQRNGNVAGARETVGSSVVQKSGIQCYNCKEFGHVMRECQKPKRAKDASYHREKMLLCKQEEAGIQFNAKQADWRDDTDDDELEDQNLEAHYMYMAQLQQVSPDAADSGPVFDDEPLQKVPNDDHYNVFAIESTHHEQSESVHDTYPIEQDAQNMSIDSLDMSYDREEIDKNDDDNDLAKERELLASLIEKLKCEIDESKNRNKILETSNKALIEKLKSEIEDFKNKKSLESSNNFFKEANNKLSETNNLLYADYKSQKQNLQDVTTEKWQRNAGYENQRIGNVAGARETVGSTVAQKSRIQCYNCKEFGHVARDTHPEQSESVHDIYPIEQDAQNVSIDSLDMSYDREEIDQNDDDNDLANERCYNDNLALMLTPDSDEVIRLEKESRSKLSDLIRPFDYDKLNNLLNAKTLNVKSVSAMCDKCVLIDKHAMCVLKSVAKPLKKTVASESNKNPRNFTRKLYERVSTTCSWWYPKFTPSGYKWKPKSGKENVNSNVSMPLGNASRTANVMDTMTSRRSTMSNTPLSFNSSAARRDCPIHRAVMIKRVYYVEGLNHNLFSVGQFCDVDLEVAFMKSTCFIRDLKGNDLLTGSRGTDLYSITLQDTNCPNPICLMAKATSSQAWLWHRRLSHLNFDTINLLSNDIVVGLPKLKLVKDHLYCSCKLGKAKRNSFHTKLTPSSKRRLQLLHMELCGPMRVTLHAYFAAEGILHQTSVARTPEQNGVVERRNRTLVEAARTMLSAAKIPLFFWAEIIATACFTQKPFSSNTSDRENLDKMKEKGDECISVSFDELPQMASDQLSSDPTPECQTMALNHDSLTPAFQYQENITQSDRTVTRSNELDLLFSLMFGELLNGSSKVVSKSSAASAADAPNQRQHHTTPLNIHTTSAPTCQVLTLVPTVSPSENLNQAESYAENAQVADDELINIFSTPVQDQGETSSRHTLHAYFAAEGILHQTPVARTLEQNGVVEIRNHTLVEAARTMLSATKKMALNHDSLSPTNQRQGNVPQADRTVTTSNELDLLFSLMFDELLNGSSKVVSKSSAVSLLMLLINVNNTQLHCTFIQHLHLHGKL
nr:integrase, catalytic region, zinc finger, CCHC-type, peptidase aspartic, catalytic [Tanacetum cinerariifolium]